MAEVQTAEPLVHNAPTFETVWAALQETDRMLKENARRHEELALSQKETDRQMQETDLQIKETNRQMKEYNKRFGDFTNRFGEMVEYMVAPNLRDKFNEMGFDFQKVCTNNKFHDNKNNIKFEVDIMLENGDKAMLVEVKTKLTTEHINEHIERIEKMRAYADLRGDKRSFLGAAAGVVIPPGVKEYALKQGFFVIEPSGETFNVTLPYNQPKEW
ncbi:MAG: hypothetical protein FWD36_09820 [Treponema sp.]|nr:hypothetical protein [Treponema sp.]